jgi:pSer/pThr/pTyr-binding forkhead associated (FHA) protein
MRLLIRQKGQVFNELRFREGPIYIGRHMGSQVFLPDRSVSRQHAVIYVSSEGTWVVEDLDSANKTFLNRIAIHKNPLNDGDTIKVGDFNIKIYLEEDSEEVRKKTSIHLDDTVANVDPDVHILLRTPDAPGAPAIKLPVKRSQDFLKASRIFAGVRKFDRLHRQVLDMIFAQFNPSVVWVGLKRQAQEDLDIAGGRKITTETIKRDQLVMASKITEAMDKSRYILIPHLPRGEVRSIIIAPVLSGKKCYGAVYACNSKQYKPYDMEDLDYLMLLTIQAAAVIEAL